MATERQHEDNLPFKEHLKRCVFEQLEVHTHGNEIVLHAIFDYLGTKFSSNFPMDPEMADNFAKALEGSAREVRGTTAANSEIH